MRTVREPSDRGEQYVKITRPTAKQAISGWPAVDEHSLFVVHHVDKRTVPCQPDCCCFCAALYPTEERIYLPMLTNVNQELVIVDLPSSHHNSLTAIAKKYVSLRNTFMHIARTRQRDNAPIIVSVKSIDDPCLKAELFGRLSERLDAVFRSNVEFAIAKLLSENRQATESSVLNDRC